jgi:hypothetical protein
MEKRQCQGREDKVLLLNRIIEFQESTGRRLMVIPHQFVKYNFIFLITTYLKGSL